MIAPLGTQLKYAVRLDFKGCTNNVAEYEGLLLGLRKARTLGARRLSIRSDSELISGQINKSNRALKPELAKYLAAVRSMEKYILGFSIRSFSRTKNKQADQLAKAAAVRSFTAGCILRNFKAGLRQLCRRTRQIHQCQNQRRLEGCNHGIPSWTLHPGEQNEEKRMALRARNYRIIGEELYRGGVCAPLLKCISREEANSCLKRYM